MAGEIENIANSSLNKVEVEDELGGKGRFLKSSLFLSLFFGGFQVVYFFWESQILQTPSFHNLLISETFLGLSFT